MSAFSFHWRQIQIVWSQSVKSSFIWTEFPENHENKTCSNNAVAAIKPWPMKRTLVHRFMQMSPNENPAFCLHFFGKFVIFTRNLDPMMELILKCLFLAPFSGKHWKQFHLIWRFLLIKTKCWIKLFTQINSFLFTAYSLSLCSSFLWGHKPPTWLSKAFLT